MKTSLAVIASAVLALSACSGGDAEPTKTVTKTATSETADVETADEEPAHGDAEGDTDPNDDPWNTVDTYDSAYDLGQAIGSDYWGEKGTNLDCSKANQEKDQVRDDFTGDRVDVTTMTCQADGTDEQATLTVMDPDTDGDALGPKCDMELEGDTCFSGTGWMVEAWSHGQLLEILEELEVDPKAAGIGWDEEDF